MKTNNEQQRAAFEAHIRKERGVAALRRDPSTDAYWYTEIANQWEGWQAAIELGRQQDGEPVAIVDHVGSSYGKGPKHPTVIVTHSADYDKLPKGTHLYLAPAFDFTVHLQRQREWSKRTFGPGPRAAGVVDHIRKELREIEADPGDLREWVDVIILALDGAWRSGATPAQIVEAIVAKQTKNEGRVWPDWRTADPNKAIEHDRGHDGAPQPADPVVKESLTVAEQAGVRPSEAVFAFAAWLTCRTETTSFASHLDAAPAAQLVSLFIDSQGWADPREDYVSRLKPYPIEQTAHIAEPVKVPSDDAIADIVRDHLTAAYVCNRVWEAWNVGTMSQDDFVEASETEMANEIAAAIVARYGQPAQPAEPVELTPETQDQIAAVMLQTGTPEQQAEALRRCGFEPVKVPSVPDNFDRARAIVETWPGWKRDYVLVKPTPPAADQAQQAVVFAHELAMGTYKPDEIEARAKAIARLAPLSTQQVRSKDIVITCETGSVSDADMVEWAADRMVSVYGEPAGIDFVLALRRIAAKLRKQQGGQL